MVFSICRTDLPKKKHQKKWYNPHDVTSSIYIIWFVVLTLLKNMKVNGKDYPIYYGKQKMFQTTNQYNHNYIYYSIYTP